MKLLPVAVGTRRRFWRAVISAAVLDFFLFVWGASYYQHDWVPSYRSNLDNVWLEASDGQIEFLCRGTAGWSPPFFVRPAYGWGGWTINGFSISWSRGAREMADYFCLVIPVWFLAALTAVAPLRWVWMEGGYRLWRRGRRGFEVVVSQPPPAGRTEE